MLDNVFEVSDVVGVIVIAWLIDWGGNDGVWGFGGEGIFVFAGGEANETESQWPSTTSGFW